MTCIVAFEDRETGKVWMGADSAGVDEWGTTMIRADQKLFKLKPEGWGSLLIGFTDSFRMGQLLRYGLDLPAPGIDPHAGNQNEFTLRCMATAFVETVRVAFRAGGFLQKKDGREEGGQFLVAWRRAVGGEPARLFEIGSDFQVGRPMYGLAAIGCGREVALGVLSATQSSLILPRVDESRMKADSLPSRMRIEAALNGAQLFKTGVLPPFVVDSI